MRQRSFILVAATVAILILGAVGVYAYDKTRDDVIAKGVTAGGVDLSGLHSDEAREALQRQLAEPLSKAVVVRYGGRHFRISARRARVQVAVDGMVDRALAESRKGNLISRTGRAITGGSVDAHIPVQITYSHRAIARFAAEVKHEIEQAPCDASIDFSGGELVKVDSRDGRETDVASLERRIASDIAEPTSDHRVAVPVTETNAKVTTRDLAQRYPRVITINRGGFRLTLYRNLRPAKSYTIAVGRQGLETPAGRYAIQDKQVNPSWHVPNSAWAGDLAGRVIPPGPADPIKARWMGIAGDAGIHGTDEIGSLGTAASHGCIRMAIPDVIELFDQVEVGDPVFIT